MDKCDYSLFWDEVIRQLLNEEKITHQEYSMWFKNMSFVENSDTVITLSVPSKYFLTQIKQRYDDILKKKFMELSGIIIDIDFVIITPKYTKTDTPPAEQIIKKEQPDKHPQINPVYSFDNFVIGDNNSFAYSAAKAIVDMPGEKYNPCLIYGGVGLGKTHLMQSIGNALYQKDSTLKIVYITAENFVIEFQNAIMNNASNNFKNKYRNVDVLLIDDIHDLQKKSGTQDELFHTFNTLYDHKKQMVFTCDRPASELRDFAERLKNRFNRGLNVDLQPPKYETRFAILKKKLESSSILIKDEILDYISKNVTSNIRDLESCLTTLKAYSELTGREIDLEIAQKQLKTSFFEPLKPNISVNLIQKKTADYFNVTTSDLKGKKRTKSVTFPRQIAMFICREITDFSTTEIGLEFGGKDHTTVMHACQKIEDIIKTDYTLESNIKEIIRAIKES